MKCSVLLKELIIGAIGILTLLEATRRAIGLPLVIIAICFLLFSYFGKYAPDIISHGGLSIKRLVGFQWFDQEAISVSYTHLRAHET